MYFTSTGHYCIKLKSKLGDENVFKSKDKKKDKVALKLHRRFSHLHSKRLLSSLQDWK